MASEIELQVGVKILLQNKDGKYLLLHRSKEKYPDASGRWDIVGGRINPGQVLIDNLKREVQEETGLKIAGEPELIAAQDILKMPGRHIVRLTYSGIAEGEVSLDTTENDKYEWFDREQIKQLQDLDIYLKELLDKNILI